MKLIQHALILVLLLSASAQAQEKPMVQTAADLPSGAFVLPAAPSTLLFEDEAAFAAVLTELEAEIQSLMANHDIQDATTRRGLLEIQRNIALIEQRWADALALSAEVRQLHDKPAEKAWSGVLADAFAQVALETGISSGPAFQTAFRKDYQSRIESLDYALVGDEIERMHGSASMVTDSLLRGQIQGGLDQAFEAQSGAVDRAFMAGLVSTATLLQLDEVFPTVAEVLAVRIQRDSRVKENLWQPRLVDLNEVEGLSPVVVGIWDSGVDTSLFEGQLWRNEREQANGLDDDGNGHIDDIHGIAYDVNDRPTAAALRSMDDVRELDELLDLVKGFLDIQAAVSSSEAAQLQQMITQLPPAEVTPFMLELNKAVLFMHGTSIADVALMDNPAARMIYGRFDYPITATPQPQSDEDVDRLVRRIHETVDYLGNAGARVINMSFAVSLGNFESGLFQTLPDPIARRELAMTRWTRVASAFEDSIARHPEVMFVAAAGNDDADVDYAKTLPAGLNAPNLMTVGAVDIALQPTGFTAFGASVDLYANGFEVAARVPGGRVISASGTSQSAPAVSNLVAKMWAIAPELSVSEVRSLIEDTSTEEGEQKLKVIHPAAAIARLRTMQGMSR